MEQPRSSLGAAWEQLRSSLEYAYSEITARTSRAYGPCPTRLRLVVTLLLMMVVGVSEVWGQITPGFYYLASNAAKADGASYSYNSSDPANSFYLCPAIGSYHDNNVDHPYLTTFKTNQDQNSLWKIEAVSGATNCYYLIHYKTGKYLASNATSSTAYDGGTNRRVVHLENKADDSDIYKFYIIDKSGSYQIYPADYRPGGTLTDASGKSLNVKADNWSMYVPQNGLATGIIGVYDYATNNKVNPGSQWKLEPLTSTQPCATPIVKYSGYEINISYPYTSETGITIYYTTDGTAPSTSSSSNVSTSFNISASGVVKVRAFATKSGFANSDEAVLWGSARPFLVQSKECSDYYLVPSGDGTKVNTSSLASDAMQWTLQNAGASTGGVPYYYLVNSKNNNKKIISETTLAMNDASADDNKFCIVENGYNTGDFFLIPISDLSKSAFKTLYKDKKKNFTDGNTGSEYNVTLETLKYYEQSNGLELWRLKACNEGADQKNLFSAPPFSASTDEVMHYYHIESVGNNGYFIVPPSSSDGYARTSNTSSDYTDNPWIFKVAASDNWLTYYYIINAASDKYMYFNPNIGLTDDQENVISMKDESEKNEGNEERFQFVMVRSTTTDACYIVPKGYSYADASHKNFYNNQYFGLWRDDANTDILKTTWSRSATANNVKWTFESTNYTNVWADPVVTCDIDGHITITNGEEADGAEFYYTKNNSTTLPATPTATESETNFKYSSSSKPTADAGFTTIKVRAIADGKQKSNVVKNTIIYNPTVALTTESYTYTGAVQNPISSVKVGETPIASSEYEVKYQKEGEDTELTEVKDAGTYTILVNDVDGGDYIVYGKNTTVTISPAALTVTADAKTKEYGDADPALTYTSEGLIGTDAIIGDLSRDAGEDVGTYAINQNTLTAGNNYAITYTPANLTINKKSLGDGTTPAAGIVINIDGNDVVTVTRTSPTSVDLTLDTDFTVSGPTEEEGNQIWTITGINNYDGGAKVMRISLTFSETGEASGNNVKDVTPYMTSTDMDIAGLDAWIVTHINMTNHKVTLQKLDVDYVPKDVPVLLLTDLPDATAEGNYTATPKYVATPGDYSANLLKKATSDLPVAFGEVYKYYQGRFVLTTDGILPAGSFYLDNPNPRGGGTSGAPLLIEFDVMTDIADARWKMDDDRDARWYTLDGRRLSRKPAKKPIKDFLKEELRVPAVLKATSGEDGIVKFTEDSNKVTDE